MRSCLERKVQEVELIHRRNFFPFFFFIGVKTESENLTAIGLYDVSGICSNGIFEVLFLIQNSYSFVPFPLDFLFSLIGKQAQVCELCF